MPVTYYERVINLYKEIVDTHGISIADLFDAVEAGENNANITKDWMYSVYREIPVDPGIKRMDALYRILQRQKKKLNRAK